MKSSVKSKGANKAARRNNAFKLLTSTAMIAMALGSASAIAGPGMVCLDGISPAATCPANVGTIGTYYANSPLLRKFVDTLPGLTPGGKNSFFNVPLNEPTGEYIPVAVPQKYSDGSDYYIIGVVEHQQRMHSDLAKPTTLRSYVQLYPKGVVVNGVVVDTKNVPVDNLTNQVLPAPYALTYPDSTPIYWPGSTDQVYSYDKPHYLGPIILAQSGTPVRTTMVNLLPKGKGAPDPTTGNWNRNGDMFLPVDESLGGAGLANATTAEKYPQNRVSFHLHGGDSPWISDGTPHQWITPAGDPTNYKSGNRMLNVPDMPFPGEGSVNLFWPNDQSARLMWYHDHTFGLTRQNAYGGNAAGYVIYDAPELALQGGIAGTNLNDPATGINKALPNGLFDQIVLVIQDKTFVSTDIATQDSKWDPIRWGQAGDLWFPHVYEPFQLWGATAPAATTPNPAAPGVIPANGTGVNPAGRWDYAVNDLGGTFLLPKVAGRVDPEYGQVSFPDGSYGAASTTPEAYMDTPVINGVAYPKLTVDPKAYRVRFLNGANDRYFNLSLWVADQAHPTEVVTVKQGAPDSLGKVNNSFDAAGVPDSGTAGPNIIQFANEAGYLPRPVVHQPSLMPYTAPDNVSVAPNNFYLGSAERADTVIDFSQYAGKTLILYNDGVAPVPGGDPRYDYYTGNPDQTLSGGAPSTLPGYGPNTRTLMQIIVNSLPVDATTGNPITVPAYDPLGNGGPLASELPKAYALAADKHVDVLATSATPPVAALPLALDPAAAKLTLSDGSSVDLKIKTIHGLNDPNIGRLVAQLGTELPTVAGSKTAARVATPLAYIDSPTEIIDQDKVQYWWIRNYDVDNHPMHFHLFNVQVLAHYDAAAIDPTKAISPTNNGMRPPTEDELGWKETVKNWPGEDLLVALKPKTPQLPFGLPNSVRLMDPTMASGATANDVLYGTTKADGNLTPFAFSQLDLDPNSGNYGGQKVGGVSNTQIDYGWEYVWHCHILGHEENDLMRPMVFHPNIASPAAPTNVTVTNAGVVTWIDPTPTGVLTTKGNVANEIGFVVQRDELSSGKTVLTERLSDAATPVVVDGRVSTLANATQLTGAAPKANTDYIYRVAAVNEAKVALDPKQPTVLSPAPLNYGTFTLKQPPLAATGLSATSAWATTWRINLKWKDNSTNESGFIVQRSTGTINTTTGVPTWTAPATRPLANSVQAMNATTFSDTSGVNANTLYQYQVYAVNGTLVSPATSAIVVSAANTGAAPALLQTTGAATTSSVGIQWQNSASALVTGYEVQQCAGTATVCSSTTAVWGPSIKIQGPMTTKFVASGLATKKPYSFRVRSVNNLVPAAANGDAGLVSPWSKVFATSTI